MKRSSKRTFTIDWILAKEGAGETEGHYILIDDASGEILRTSAEAYRLSNWIFAERGDEIEVRHIYGTKESRGAR